MNRFDITDFVHVCIFSVFVVQLLCFGWTASIVVAVFVVTNFGLICYWFCLPSCSTDAVAGFLANLKVGAHRGGSEDAPENTLGAFKQAIALGVDAIELDLEFTQDDVAIVFHDDTVDRLTDGTGSIRELTWETVQKLNTAYRFRNRSKFPFETVPTFEQSILSCLEGKTRIFIDVKKPHPMAIPAILDMFQKYPELYNSAAVCSFFPQVTYEVKRSDPNIITGHTWRRGFFAYQDIENLIPRFNTFHYHLLAQAADWLFDYFLHNWLWKLSGADLLLAQRKMISPEYIESWRRRGLHPVAWTVDDYHEKLHLTLDLDIPILTDRLSDITNLMTR